MTIQKLLFVICEALIPYSRMNFAMGFIDNDRISKILLQLLAIGKSNRAPLTCASMIMWNDRPQPQEERHKHQRRYFP